MAWCGTRKAEKLLNNLSDVVVFDLETTGVDIRTAEILQISLCDGNGCQLFSSYVKPRRKSWKIAEKINGISPTMVADAPTFAKIRPEIQRIFNNAKVVAGYNCKRFDIPIIERYGITVPMQCFDVMSEFSAYHPIGTHRLIDCSDYCGVSFSPHDAESDAYATARCMEALLNMPGFVKPKQNKESDYNYSTAPTTQAKRPVTSRLFGFLFRKHKPHLILFGLLLMVIGIGVLYHQQGGSFESINIGLLNPKLIFAAAQVSRKSMIFGILIPLGAVGTVLGIIKTVKAVILWIINLFRKLFD